MANTTATSPGTMATDATVGTIAWTNPNNAKASDNVYSVAQSISFIAGTKIKTPTGEIGIEGLQPGDEILSFNENEQVRTSKVYSIAPHIVETVVKLKTEKGQIVGTPEHPFYIGNGEFRQVKYLNVNDYIYTSDFYRTKILSKINILKQTKVYTLAVDNDHTYFANDFAVHNKTIWHYLKATNFGFSVPTGSTIDGILVEIEMKSSNIGGTDSARIVKDGSIGSTDRNNGVNNFPGATESYISYGSTSDIWGEVWTAENINDSTFGVAYSVNITGNTISVDHIRITVYYTELSAGSISNIQSISNVVSITT